MAKDYYATLGVKKEASADEIKKAFRKLAAQHHPDKGGDEAKFKEVNEAYTVLSNEEKRKQYDAYGSDFQHGFGGQGGFNGGGGFGGFDFSQYTQSQDFDLGDIFGDLFGGGRREKTKRGQDITIDMTLSFKESIFGTSKQFTIHKTAACELCKGTGAEPGTEFETCKTCNGKGKIREVKRTILGSMATERACETCYGAGKKPKVACKNCKGHGVEKRKQELDVKIPAGIDDGEMMRMTGAGEAVAHGKAGDLYIRVEVTPDKMYRKEGFNIVADLPIKISDALLGGEQKIATLDGDVTIKIPEGITSGEILRVRGKGVPHSNSRGDLLLRVSYMMPKKLSKSARKIIEDLKSEGL